jgi:hypothetical protein
MQENQDDHTIEYIISTFQNFALADIKFNRDRPIAAALLSGCLLDQISGFLFEDKGKATDKARKFVKKYMPAYDEIRIYDILRNSLVHNYSLPKQYAVTSDVPATDLGLSILPNGIIYIPSFIQDLEIAVNNAMKDLREDGEVRKNAIVWEKTHPVLRMSSVNLAIYSGDEIKRLEAHFIPKIKEQSFFQSEPLECRLIPFALPNEKFQAVLEIKELSGEKKTTQWSLEGFVKSIGLESPIEFLES